MKISVITATFNSSKSIEKVIKCLKQQTYTNFEWIVIDGGSSDNTIDLVRQSELADILVSEPDRGIYDALNKGILLASGDVIGFLHSDDRFFCSSTLATIAKGFNSMSVPGFLGKQVDAVYGNLIFVKEQAQEKVFRYWESQSFHPGLLLRGWMPPHPTLYLRKEVYQKHGFYRIDLRCAADYDYILRVFKDKTFLAIHLPCIITVMQLGGASTRGIRGIVQKKIEDYRVLKSHKMPLVWWILFLKNFSKIPQLFKKRARLGIID